MNMKTLSSKQHLKLYASPGACSMSCHIAFEESGLPFEPVVAKWGDKNWVEINRLNPQHAVPVLVWTEPGQPEKSLTQNIAILTLIADLAPASGLLPPVGTFDRAQAYQWLSWVGADLHPTFGALFDDELAEDLRKETVDEVKGLLAQAEQFLTGKTFLVGNQFTVADAFLFTVYGWTKVMKIETGTFPRLNAYSARIAERPAVQKVLEREGLIKSSR